MTATRVHRALRTEDLLACVLSQLDVADGCKQRLVSVCTVWRDAWRRCCKDKYRAMRLHVGDLDHCDYAVTSPNGVIVSDYGHSRLVEYSSHGSERAVYCQKFRDPNALICCGDGTAWVACARDSSNCWRLVRVKLGRCHPDGPLWPNDGWQSPSDDSRVLQLIVLRESHLDFPRGLALSDDNKLLVLNVGTKSSPAEKIVWGKLTSSTPSRVRPCIVSVKRPVPMVCATQEAWRYPGTYVLFAIPGISWSRYLIGGRGSS